MLIFLKKKIRFIDKSEKIKLNSVRLKPDFSHQPPD
jgi:hypothetical protein